MKTSLAGIACACVVALTGTSCMTTYDAYGRPVQSVDPALAVAGIAAAGVAGYALAESNDNNNYYYNGNYYHRPVPRPYCRPTYHHYYGSGHRHYVPPPCRPVYRPYY